jgi:hypothetical protein
MVAYQPEAWHDFTATTAAAAAVTGLLFVALSIEPPSPRHRGGGDRIGRRHTSARCLHPQADPRLPRAMADRAPLTPPAACPWFFSVMA